MRKCILLYKDKEAPSLVKIHSTSLYRNIYHTDRNTLIKVQNLPICAQLKELYTYCNVRDKSIFPKLYGFWMDEHYSYIEFEKCKDINGNDKEQLRQSDRYKRVVDNEIIIEDFTISDVELEENWCINEANEFVIIDFECSEHFKFSLNGVTIEIFENIQELISQDITNKLFQQAKSLVEEDVTIKADIFYKERRFQNERQDSGVCSTIFDY